MLALLVPDLWMVSKQACSADATLLGAPHVEDRQVYAYIRTVLRQAAFESSFGTESH